MGDELKRPPEAIPQVYEASLSKLSRQARNIFDLKTVPYYIQIKMADDGYHTVEDLADRWDKAEDARSQGPRDLDFEAGTHGYTTESTRLCAMKLYQAVKMAKHGAMGSVAFGAESQNSSKIQTPVLDMACDRAQLEIQYQDRTQCGRPPIEDQGSDVLLKKQFRYCSKGEIGFFQSRSIVSLLPDSDERPSKRQRQIVVSGQVLEDEDEFRQNPVTLRQLERLHKVFQTNLLMCVFAFPQFSQLDISKKDLDDCYHWFYGPSIANRQPAPSVHTLMMAERNAWREITRKMHTGTTLRQALAEVKADLLFWQREVYERLQSRPPPAVQRPSPSPWPSPYKKTKPSFEKGRGKGKRPPKGKGKGKPSKGKGASGKGAKGGKGTWPQNWAREDPRGIPFCLNFLIKGQCPGQCGRSHNCPVMKDGWVCNSSPDKHHPSQCPQA